MKKLAMYVKHLMLTPIPLKVNQSNNIKKKINKMLKSKNIFLDNKKKKKTLISYPLNKQ